MSHAASPSPVAALTVVDGETLTGGAVTAASRVLVVVRDPAANPTHPNVVSVPTMRIPRVLYDAARDEIVDSDIHNGHSPTVSITEALFARKLGLADALESGEAAFEAAVRTHVEGVAVYDNFGEDVEERVAMLGILVVLTRGAALLGEPTTSFSHVTWRSVDSFLRSVESRDPSALGDDLDPLELCVHGVCLKAAEATLRGILDRAPFTSDLATDELVLRPASLVDTRVTVPR